MRAVRVKGRLCPASRPLTRPIAMPAVEKMSESSMSTPSRPRNPSMTSPRVSASGLAAGMCVWGACFHVGRLGVMVG